MVFSSHIFLFYFLPLALLLYFAIPNRGKHAMLTLTSYLFYGWANPLFVVLMLVSTLIDYLCGLVIAGQPGKGGSVPLRTLEKGGPRTSRQKAAVVLSICSNLALLGFFKYFNFATESYDAVVGALGLPGLDLDLAFRVTLPLGISFYTFQSMSYSIDLYRGDARAIRNFIDFACYVSMFPQLVAGPIIRFQEVADQLTFRTHTFEKFARGVAFLCMGLAKKILLANTCGKVADVVFGASGASVLDAWYGIVAYAFQIYYDFSAYSDMAIGLGLMLGFVFTKNFDSPYRSQSITEFWRRWHISLSTWLRDYLYIPLGGNRKGARRTYVNLALVMILGGLWHGAAWTFLIWGIIHGGMLVLERLGGKTSLYSGWPKPLRIAITFAIVCLAWVFFRADDIPHALRYLSALFGLGQVPDGARMAGAIIYQPYYLAGFSLAGLLAWFGQPTWDFTRRITAAKAALILGLFLLSVVLLTTQSFNPFIYFIF